MQTMREKCKSAIKGVLQVNELKECGDMADKILDKLEPELNCEICRVLNDVLCDVYRTQNVHYFMSCSGQVMKEKMVEILNMHLSKHSPKHTYCEGMNEAIGNDVIKPNKNWQYYDVNDQLILRCPYCPGGENCIGGK